MFCRILFLFLFIVEGSVYSFSKVPSEQVQIVDQAIGVRTFKYQDENRKRPVTVELWYPTTHMGPWDKPKDTYWIHPKEARNVPIEEGKYPLIIMSHGHRGDRRERSWLADSLVRQGYLVAAVEHFGNTRKNYNPLISLRFWERPRDITFALDQLLEDPLLKEKIDRGRIGFVGYSLGGMTGLGLAGAVAKNLKESFFKHKKSLELESVKGEVLEKIDLAEGEKSYKEPRIRAFLLICPAMFVYSAESLKEIDAPIGLVAAINDEVLPHQEHSYQIIKHLVPTKLKVMRKEISHYTFLNPFSKKGKKMLKKSFRREFPDPEPVHREVASFALSFFEETLRKDTE